MTTNKPEVLGFAWSFRQAREVVAARSTFVNQLRNDGVDLEPLIRLSDYEARMAVLFDGYAVYSAMTDKDKQHTSPESVAAVLDAVVKLMGRCSHDNQ